jgi:hypothetical protein
VTPGSRGEPGRLLRPPPHSRAASGWDGLPNEGALDRSHARSDSRLVSNAPVAADVMSSGARLPPRLEPCASVVEGRVGDADEPIFSSSLFCSPGAPEVAGRVASHAPVLRVTSTCAASTLASQGGVGFRTRELSTALMHVATRDLCSTPPWLRVRRPRARVCPHASSHASRWWKGGSEMSMSRLLHVLLTFRRSRVESRVSMMVTCFQRDLNMGTPATQRSEYAWRFPRAQRIFGLSPAVVPPLEWMNR